MAVKLYNDTDIQNIADSIRAKNGSGYTYKVSEMSAEINGLEVLNGETVSITPSTSAQTITPSSGHNGITEVNVDAVTSSIDSNIQAGNIKKDISILGVTGTLNEGVDINDYFSNTQNDYSYTSGKLLLQYIKKVPPLNISNRTRLSDMFAQMNNLLSIEEIDTSNVTSMYGMFRECENLITIPALNAEKVTDIDGVLSYTSSLTNVGGFINLGMAYDTSKEANYSSYTLQLGRLYMDSYSKNLTHESLMNIINNLYDIKTKGCNAQKLILGTTNINKLTSEEIAIATNKGWTVS